MDTTEESETPEVETPVDDRPAREMLNPEIRAAQVAMEEARRNYLRVVATVQAACPHHAVAEASYCYIKPHYSPPRRLCLHCGLVEEAHGEDEQYLVLQQPNWVMDRSDVQDVHHGPILNVATINAWQAGKYTSLAELLELWRESEHRIWTPPDYHDYQKPPSFRETLDELYPLKNEKETRVGQGAG